MTIKELQKEVHKNAIEHGWWDNPQDFGTLIALCHSELSEALEERRSPNKYGDWYYSGKGYIANKPTECCKKPDGVAFELADTVIRIMDMCEYYSIDLEAAIIEKHEYNKLRPYKHGGKAF